MIIRYNIAPFVNNDAGADGVPTGSRDVDLHNAGLHLCNHSLTYGLNVTPGQRGNRHLTVRSRLQPAATVSINGRGCTPLSKFPACKQANAEDQDNDQGQQKNGPCTQPSPCWWGLHLLIWICPRHMIWIWLRWLICLTIDSLIIYIRLKHRF